MITVYGRRNSSSVQLVMWAIHELGLEHQRLDYGHGHKATNTDAYLAMNPMGRIGREEDIAAATRTEGCCCART